MKSILYYWLPDLRHPKRHPSFQMNEKNETVAVWAQIPVCSRLIVSVSCPVQIRGQEGNTEVCLHQQITHLSELVSTKLTMLLPHGTSSKFIFHCKTSLCCSSVIPSHVCLVITGHEFSSDQIKLH